jgi:hypothetical protein
MKVTRLPKSPWLCVVRRRAPQAGRRGSTPHTSLPAAERVGQAQPRARKGAELAAVQHRGGAAPRESVGHAHTSRSQAPAVASSALHAELPHVIKTEASPSAK